MKRLVAMLAIAVMCGCTTGSPPDAAKVLRDGGAAMGKLTTATAALKLTKGTITIQSFKLVSAKTSVRLPSDSDTIYTVKEQDVSFGLHAVIPEGTDPKYVKTEQIDGKDCYQIATTYTAAQVRSLISELDSSGPVNAHVWVGTTDHFIRKAVLSGAFGDSGSDATVEVTINSFNGPVVISSPTP